MTEEDRTPRRDEAVEERFAARLGWHPSKVWALAGGHAARPVESQRHDSARILGEAVVGASGLDPLPRRRRRLEVVLHHEARLVRVRRVHVRGPSVNPLPKQPDVLRAQPSFPPTCVATWIECYYSPQGPHCYLF